MTVTSDIKDLDQLVVRLERNHKCVLRLSKKMNSYIYEPRNYECFIRLRDLRVSLKELAKDHMQLFNELQHEDYDFKEAVKNVEGLLKRFKKFDRDLAQYVLDTRGDCQ
ncbi:hypothetical protein MTsPCn5_05460 [Croceitalea sp. MTPC5]|uniref:hypothetical protein n=1 Tax=Croceitalea sp. MTPC5 TaxID=3056565 RepID=UPI002B3F396E|nr:hypothetical protein MTsPCn5_05460 [Croceitalea sp. MTPC5]